ncbi:helix-turn-helix transcriptional regulator, partial [Vannielia sp.]|uniref:helix-turn-helix domain-containing protein n=1 Tax=Vannielia sp. TaxID=2813045 RepID=UPI00261D1C14
MPKVPQETLDAFGKAVFRARSLKGWTHDQLGAAMDGSSSKSFLSGIENGKRQISPPTVGRLINALNLDESWIDRFIDADTTPEAEANATRILDDAEEAGAVKRLAEAGVTETALIKLAQRITGQTSDLSQAWLELQNAMEIAVRVQAEGAGGSNHGDFVDEVLRRVAALSAEGSYAEAGEAIEAALAEEAAAHERRVERLLGSGIELAMLEGDAEKAASLLIRRADHAAGGQAGVAALR